MRQRDSQDEAKILNRMEYVPAGLLNVTWRSSRTNLRVELEGVGARANMQTFPA